MAVPLGRLDHTVRGRGDLLAELVGLVRSDVGRVVVLHGAGGNGKTTVALALADAVADQVRTWWVDATSSTSLAEGLREVALAAGADWSMVRAAWSGEASASELLWRSLAGVSDRWLLVLDNADDTTLLAAEGHGVAAGRGWLRTPPRTGTVVVTSRESRSPVWGHQALLRPVPVLTDIEGAAVLLELAPAAGSEQDASALSQRLGGLPLVLRLAGTYLAATAEALELPGWDVPRTFADYRHTWEVQFDEITTPVHTTVADEREVLGTTWELSLDLLANRGLALARPVLRLASFLAAAPIPYVLLDAQSLVSLDLFADLRPAVLAEVLDRLIDLGLLEKQDKDPSTRRLSGVVMHPVVRDTTQHQADALNRADQYQTACLALIDRATRGLGHADPEAWPLWAMLLPHCQHMLGHYSWDGGANSENAVAAGAVAYRAARYCFEIGLAGIAETLYRRALDIRKHGLGDEHPLTLGTRRWLAHVLQARGDLVAAEAELRDVVAVCERVQGSEHPDTLVSRHRLTHVLEARGDLAGADVEFRDLLAAQQLVLGTEHPDTLRTRHDLAHVLEARGDVAGADVEFRDLLAVQQLILGTEHSDTLSTRDCLAGVLRKRGDLAGAEAELRDIVTIRERVLGAEHPDTLITRHDLAHVLERGGDVAGADVEFRDLLAAQQLILGTEHPTTLRTRGCLAGVLRKCGDLAGAEAELRDILTVRGRVLGTEHPDTLRTRHDLAHVLEEGGDVAGADVEFRDLLAVQQLILGTEHPDTLRTGRCLARVPQRAGLAPTLKPNSATS